MKITECTGKRDFVEEIKIENTLTIEVPSSLRDMLDALRECLSNYNDDSQEFIHICQSIADGDEVTYSSYYDRIRINYLENL